MTVLVLGGTSDGRRLADALHNEGVSVLYSVAGLVRPPKVDCEYISGGFSQFGGMANFIAERKISAVMDATHPYAVTISENAKVAADQTGVPCWRFLRAPWGEQPGQQWIRVNNWQAVLDVISNYERPLFTTGQLPEWVAENLGKQKMKPVLRTAVEPAHSLPDNIEWIKAIGPFALDDETILMADRHIDVLISKNAGGDATEAKIKAAAQQGVPVVMFERPQKIAVEQEFDELKACQRYCTDWYKNQKQKDRQ